MGVQTSHTGGPMYAHTRFMLVWILRLRASPRAERLYLWDEGMKGTRIGSRPVPASSVRNGKRAVWSCGRS